MYNPLPVLETAPVRPRSTKNPDMRRHSSLFLVGSTCQSFKLLRPFLGIPGAIALRAIIGLYTQQSGNTRKLCYRKDDRAMRPMYGCPENFRESLSTPTATFAEIFDGLLFQSILWICVQKLKFVALPVPEIIGGTQKFWADPAYAHALFSPNFLMGFCSDGPCECTGNCWSPYSFTRSCDNSDWSFGWGLRTPNVGEEDAAGGRRWYRSKERWWVPIGPP